MRMRKKLTVSIGADHAGFVMKKRLAAYLKTLRVSVVDRGAKKLLPKDDYPDYAYRVAKDVATRHARGILVCGSAQGVCMVANKVRGVRAATLGTVHDARLTREHNDANVLCLSGWGLPLDQAKAIVRAFLETPYSGETRHERRLRKLAIIERKTMR